MLYQIFRAIGEKVIHKKSKFSLFRQRLALMTSFIICGDLSFLSGQLFAKTGQSACCFLRVCFLWNKLNFHFSESLPIASIQLRQMHPRRSNWCKQRRKQVFINRNANEHFPPSKMSRRAIQHCKKREIKSCSFHAVSVQSSKHCRKRKKAVRL